MEFALDRALSAGAWMQYNFILNTVALALLVSLNPPAGRLGKWLIPMLAGVTIVVGIGGFAIWREQRVIALACAVLAIAAFGALDRVRHFGPFRWIVTATAVLFIPNAAYSITHGVHWVVDLNARATDGWMLFIAGVQYAAYVAYSLLALQLGLWLITHRVRREGYRRHATVLTLVFLSSLAVYLGRMERFNSWDPLTNPPVLGEMISTLAPLWQMWLATSVYAATTLVVAASVPRLIGAFHVLPGESVGDRLPELSWSMVHFAAQATAVLWMIIAGGYLGLWWLAPALTEMIDPPIQVGSGTASIVTGIALIVGGIHLSRRITLRSMRVCAASAIALASLVVLGGIATFWIAHESGWPRHRLGTQHRAPRPIL